MANQIDIGSLNGQVEYGYSAVYVGSAYGQVEYGYGSFLVASFNAQVEFDYIDITIEPPTEPPTGDYLTLGDWMSTTSLREIYPNFIGEQKRKSVTYAPWHFISSPDVLGYINNPNWEVPATIPHDPCGYWPSSVKKNEIETVLGPPMGRVVAASVQWTRPYTYALCTNKYLYKLNMLNGRIDNWLYIPITCIDMRFTQAWDGVHNSLGDHDDDALFCVSAIDQFIWCSPSGTAVVDKYMYVALLRFSVFEVFKINLFSWAVTSTFTTTLSVANTVGIRGGHSHGDYSIWGLTDFTVVVFNNLTMQIDNTSYSTELVPDFDSLNRLLLTSYVPPFGRTATFAYPAILAGSSTAWLELFVIFETADPYDGDFERTFAGLQAGGWGWDVSGGIGHTTFSGYHPTYTRIRVAYSGAIFHTIDTSNRHAVKHTRTHFLQFLYGNVGSPGYTPSYVTGGSIVGAFLDLDGWNGRGQSFDSGHWGAAVFTVNHNTHEQRFIVYRDSTYEWVIPTDSPSKSRWIGVVESSIDPVWPFSKMNELHVHRSAAKKSWLD